MDEVLELELARRVVERYAEEAPTIAEERAVACRVMGNGAAADIWWKIAGLVRYLQDGAQAAHS